MQLRDYQLAAAVSIGERLQAGVTRQLLKFATGLGKTALFCALPSKLGFVKRILVLDHREELTSQAEDRLRVWNEGHPVGLEMGSRYSDEERFVVAGVQTIGPKGSPRLAKFNPFDFDMLVVDEAHHATATSYQNVINHFTRNPKLLLLGTTATPNRADGEGLNQVFEEIVDDKDILFGINNGWLADLRGIRIRTGSNLDHVHKLAGDFDLGELANEVNTPARNDLIVCEWMKHAQSRKTVAFCVDVQHTKDLAVAFKGRGILAEAVWGGDPLRDQKLAHHRAGSLSVLTNCGILTEGYDDPGVGCIIMARPTGSEGLYTQILGRGTRIPADIDNLLTARRAGVPIVKDDCVVLDFVDATARHSLVSLASLFGMPKADLKGRKISEVIAQLAAAKKTNPYLDISRVEDADKIKAYAQQVDLFKVSYPPEIIQISSSKWHKMRENSYVVTLPPPREGMCVQRDLLGVWHAVGTIAGVFVHKKYNSLEPAIRKSDNQIEELCGNAITALIRRDPRWGKNGPSPKLRMFARRLNIVVQPGASGGEVSAKIKQVLAQNAARRQKG